MRTFHRFDGIRVKVELDRPAALRIDGETVTGASEYTVKSSALAEALQTAWADRG